MSEKTRRGVQQANRNKGSTSKPSMEYKDGDDENIFTMEHINVDGISAREGMVEYQNVLGAFKHMEAGMFSVSEHTLDTTQSRVRRRMYDLKIKVDAYAKIEAGSCGGETTESWWKPGGTLLGISGRWASRLKEQGSDRMGRWSWMDLRGKNNKIIKVISAYRVSQEYGSQAGVLTAYQQQYRALVKQKRGELSPRAAFLADLEHEVMQWIQKPVHEIVILMDANEAVEEKKELRAFEQSLNLVDAVALLNPSAARESTYLWEKKKTGLCFLFKGFTTCSGEGWAPLVSSTYHL